MYILVLRKDTVLSIKLNELAKLNQLTKCIFQATRDRKPVSRIEHQQAPDHLVTRNPQLVTRNPQPATRNPQLATRNS